MSLLLALLLSASADPWEDVAATAGLEPAEVRQLLDGVEKDQTILDRMATPWESKPWHVYKKIFEDDKRLNDGLAFWEAHADALAAAEAKTGVPPQIVLAILGVESQYGTRMGDDRVLTSLYTLGFFHEKRGAFFRGELGHYLRLAKDEGWPLDEPRGSYAGAMGMGQFIPSSYRHFAVDGDGDGRRDLFRNPDDAIASVANYFAEHGWKKGESVLLPATGDGLEALVTKGRKPDTTWAALKAAGVGTAEDLPDDAPIRVFDFALADGTDYRLGRHNFYVITQYNHSKLYARAVYELSERLREARGRARTED